MSDTRTPWLSIVVPTLNESAQVKDTLRVLQLWRCQGVEVIVVDGGSSDGTLTLAEPLADQVLSSNKGRARQMNHGAVHARGSALLFLHADTRLTDEALHALRALIQENAEIWGRFDVRIDGPSPMFAIIAWCMNRRSRWTQISTGDQAQFFSRAIFYRIGKFPQQPLMEDIEISRRAKRLQAPVSLPVKITTSGRRWQQYGVWRTIGLMWCLRYRYWRGVSASVLAKAYR